MALALNIMWNCEVSSLSQRGRGRMWSAFANPSCSNTGRKENVHFRNLSFLQYDNIQVCLWNHFRITFKQEEKKNPTWILSEQISLPAAVIVWGKQQKYFHSQISCQKSIMVHFLKTTLNVISPTCTYSFPNAFFFQSTSFIEMIFTLVLFHSALPLQISITVIGSNLNTFSVWIFVCLNYMKT